MEVARGEVGIPPHKCIRAMSQERGYRAFCLAAHGQSRGERMSQRVPAYPVTVQLGSDHSRPEDSGVEVPLIQWRGERFRGIYERACDVPVHLLNLSRP